MARLLPGRRDGKPRAAYFGRNARKVRQEFMQLVDRLKMDTTLPTIIRETSPKWSGLLARLSLIMHVAKLAQWELKGEEIRREDKYFVEDWTVAKAATFLRKIALPNLYRLGFETMPEEGAPHVHARWIAGHILAHGLDSVTARDIGRVHRPLRGKGGMETERAMAVLCDAGWVTMTEGRHDSKCWIVNPAVHSCFQEAAQAERERRAEVVQTIREQTKVG